MVVGFRVQDLGCRIWDLVLQDVGLSVEGRDLRVLNPELRASMSTMFWEA